METLERARMRNEPELLSVLACPRCDRSPLDTNEEGLLCAGCKVVFPNLEGMPWLFAEPMAALEEWRTRWRFALRSIERNRLQLSRSLESRELRESTRRRLEKSAAVLDDHDKRLRKLLEPLQLAPSTAEYATYLALRTRLPPDQGLLTYYNNIHRDWAWGEEENEASFAAVADAMQSHAGRLLVLGAGSGRLAYDLHMRTAPKLTVALDFNPLLMLLAQRMAAGEHIALYEFPLAPKDATCEAVLRNLSAGKPARDGLCFVIADSHRPPFAKHSFDAVVTPWLVDILPEPFDMFAQRINALLSHGGCWVNFGSLSFREGNPALRYSLEECIEILEETGFEAPKVETRTMPYMCSPASRHGRREEIVIWSAVKSRSSKKAPRYEALPDWIVRGNSAVPLSEAFRTQAMTTRVHAFIMSLIDGKRSLKDIAKIVAEQKLMTYEEAEPSIRSFLTKMHDEARKMSGS
jgi:uncharacterized protein YbaR (Trm112 family)